MILLINLTLVLKDRIVYIFRETQTDESDVEGDTEASDSQEPSIQDQLELILKMQELESSKRETTAALEEARAVKAQAHKDNNNNNTSYIAHVTMISALRIKI